MTSHFFHHQSVNLHYYRFGNGPKAMLCFHGYGMHGRQFLVLEKTLGNDYTFYGFDLFFHEQTTLVDNTVEIVKKGITTAQFAEICTAFLQEQHIDRFAIIAYSLGSYYAAALVQQLANRIDNLFILAPLFAKPFPLMNFFAKNKLGNRIYEWLLLSKYTAESLLKFALRIKVIDLKTHGILHKEIATKELRFSMYASITYLKHLSVNEKQFVDRLNAANVKSYFIFGKRDALFPPHITDRLIKNLNHVKHLVLDEDHEMVNEHLSTILKANL